MNERTKKSAQFQKYSNFSFIHKHFLVAVAFFSTFFYFALPWVASGHTKPVPARTGTNVINGKVAYNKTVAKAKVNLFFVIIKIIKTFIFDRFVFFFRCCIILVWEIVLVHEVSCHKKVSEGHGGPRESVLSVQGEGGMGILSHRKWNVTSSL